MHRDLIVFSHLRWPWVWQRPQHLVSRVGRGRRVWFVEEPWPGDVEEPRLRREDHDSGITRVWLDVPDHGRDVGFEEELLAHYEQGLPALVGRSDERVVWLYSPLPVQVARSLDPDVLVYDVMDDLASFHDAPRHLVVRQRQALQQADVVFAGGRTLHRDVAEHRPDAHLLPSGVEPEHYAAARDQRTPGDVPVAGYVGVIDERLDVGLIAGLAGALPDWEVQMVGPVTKIDPDDLPVAPNIRYLGRQPYECLPQVMAGLDVALMPFALNEATRSISPTKTLEYLAAGLPVVSTRVPDVVAGYTGVVDLQDDAAGFADACRRVVLQDVWERDRRLRPLLYANHWDTIAARMEGLVDARLAGSGRVAEARA